MTKLILCALILVAGTIAHAETIPSHPGKLPKLDTSKLSPIEACAWFKKPGYDYWSVRLDRIEAANQVLANTVAQEDGASIRNSIHSSYKKWLVGSQNDETDIRIAKLSACKWAFEQAAKAREDQILPMEATETERFLAVHYDKGLVGEMTYLYAGNAKPLPPPKTAHMTPEELKRLASRSGPRTSNTPNMKPPKLTGFDSTLSVVKYWSHCLEDDLEGDVLASRANSLRKAKFQTFAEHCWALIK